MTDKIYREGVEKGNEEAQRLIANDQEEAKKIIEDAHKEADSIVAASRKSAEELAENKNQFFQFIFCFIYFLLFGVLPLAEKA